MAATGFIGTGTIGGPMAMRLVGAGHALTVFDLDPQATRALEDQGATRAAVVADVAAECTTVFLSLPGPKQIEQVMFGADGIRSGQDIRATPTAFCATCEELVRKLDLGDLW